MMAGMLAGGMCLLGQDDIPLWVHSRSAEGLPSAEHTNVRRAPCMPQSACHIAGAHQVQQNQAHLAGDCVVGGKALLEGAALRAAVVVAQVLKWRPAS